MSDDTNFLRLARRVKTIEESGYATEAYVQDAMSEAGTGDMLKSVYDPDDDGKIAYADLYGAPSIPDQLSDLSDDSTHRTVTDAEKTAWSGKQDALGYTPVPNTRTVNGQALSSDITITIPDQLSDLADDSNHRVVTDVEKSTWNGKQDALAADTDYLTPATAASTYEPVKGADDNYVTDAEKTKLSNLSGINTGDETQATIKTKLGAASASTDGYLTPANFSTFNGKQNALGYTPENAANKNTDQITGYSDTEYPSCGAVTKTLDNIFALYDSIGNSVVRPAVTTQNYTITVGTGKDYETIAAAIASLPSEINHQVTIEVYNGTYGQCILSRIRGSGILLIKNYTGDTVFLKAIITESCSLNLYFQGVETYYTDVRRCRNVHFTDITITQGSGSGHRIANSSVYIYGGEVSNKDAAINATDRAMVWLRGVTGSNNTNPIYALNSIVTGTHTITASNASYSEGSIILSTEYFFGGRTFAGIDNPILTGTPGTSGNLAQWNADGDLVGANIAASTVLTTENAIKCRAYSTSSTSAPHSTNTYIALGAESFDTDTMHDNTTNNSRLTCKTAGDYMIIGNVEFCRNSTGIRAVNIVKNHTATIASNVAGTVPDATGWTTCSVCTVVTLAVNDYIELAVYQDSGTTLTIGENVASVLSMIKV